MSTTSNTTDIPAAAVVVQAHPTKSSTPVIEGQEKEAPVKKSESSLKSFISGGVGGACAVLVGHPLDLVKVRMQTGGASSNSVFGMLSTTMRTEGIRGLYRGVSAPLTAVTPMVAVSFWSYDMGQRVMKYYGQYGMNEEEKAAPYTLSMGEICVAGAFSSIPTTAIMAPSERIKCLLQVQANEVGKGGKAKYSGMMDCAKNLLKEGGLASLYKGTGATLLRDVPGAVPYFGTYELTKREIMKIQGIDPTNGQLSLTAVLFGGGFAGMACWGVGIPVDVLKSRLQTAPEGKYNGIHDVYKTLIKEEGYAGLFKGMRPALIRAFPANAACFLGVEVTKKILGFMD
jgi:solute carrier family 25 carnitine/acylcarnitine transporter 20/29